MATPASKEKVDNDEDSPEARREKKRQEILLGLDVDSVGSHYGLAECRIRHLEMIYTRWKSYDKDLLDPIKAFESTTLNYTPGHSTVFETVQGMSYDVTLRHFLSM